MLEQNTPTSSEADAQTPVWGENAPRGGKTVLNRIIKEKATVPLFFGQTLIRSLRDVGYNSTTSALCEHIDNAIQWGATEVRVYFSQTGKKGAYQTNILVLDNGNGMAPNVLKFATSFGGSMVFDNRSGIGRFGMGMKTAALSMSPILDIYSWQESGAYYNMTLDVEAIGKEKSNLIELPDPTLMDLLPSEVSDILTKALSFPDRNEQSLFAQDVDELKDRLGKSGTIVYLPLCDRLTFAKARTLCEHAIKEMSRVYRRALAKGTKLYVNNRLVEPFDPTYSMVSARHTRIPEIRVKESRVVFSKVIQVKRSENHSQESENVERAPVTIRLYALPISDWGALPLKVRKNDLHLYDDNTVSVLRNDREVFIGTIPEIMKRHSDANWLRIQIDFPGELDEAFGVAANKQGIRPKDYVLQDISEALSGEITALREQIKKYQSEQTVIRHGSKPSAGEMKADEAELRQAKALIEPTPNTPEEQRQLDENLRTLAMMLKREMETDEEAFERVKSSKHIIHYKHDEYWPFYHVDQRFGKIILTINTAHPFYGRLYEPLSNAALTLDARVAEGAPTSAENNASEPQTFNGAQQTLVALQLMLLSLARAQSLMAQQDPERKQMFDLLRKEWSDTYATQLTTF
ncbi:ATP-binding protein [bacterium]|nr:ATP-binding protein [bacterium]